MKTQAPIRYKKILITGGSGFLGDALFRALDKYGVQITLSVRNRDSAEPDKPCLYALTDVRDADAVSELVSRHDFVFHLAGAVGNNACNDNIREAVETNIKGTLNVLAAMKTFSKPGVFASVGNTDDQTIYAITKAAAERFVAMYNKEHHTSILSLKIFNVYGENQGPSGGKLISNLINAGIRGEDLSVYGDGSQRNDFIHVDDAANLIASAVELSQDELLSGPLHVGTAKSTSVLEVATLIQELTGNKSTIAFSPMRTGEMLKEVVADRSKLMGPPSFEFLSLKTGLLRTIAKAGESINNV